MSNWRVSAISRAVVMITLDGAVLIAGAGGGGREAGVAATRAGAGAGLGHGLDGSELDGARKGAAAPTSISGNFSCACVAPAAKSVARLTDAHNWRLDFISADPNSSPRLSGRGQSNLRALLRTKIVNLVLKTRSEARERLHCACSIFPVFSGNYSRTREVSPSSARAI